jgi:FtsP/CotA-like multicopper oxidase with cupredoxin domain
MAIFPRPSGAYLKPGTLLRLDTIDKKVEFMFKRNVKLNGKTTPIVLGLLLLASNAAAQTECSGTGNFFQELRDPPMVTARGMELSTRLTARPEKRCVTGRAIELQSYIDETAQPDPNRRPVGPMYVLELPSDVKDPGPVFKIQFKNQLAAPGTVACPTSHGAHHAATPAAGEPPVDVNKCTNLHVHGLHVSPKGSDDLDQVQSDNVLLTIPPRLKPVQYEYLIPGNHAPGTHWLHAHLHGSTAPQLRNGMSGAILLKGKLDAQLASLGITGDKDKVMILQQLTDPADTSNSTPVCGTFQNGTQQESIKNSINGQCLPIITVRAGEIQRWRFIDAGISETMNLTLRDKNDRVVPLNEFARDGITMNGIYAQENIVLQPGYRSDVLVNIPVCPNNSYPCELFLRSNITQGRDSMNGVAQPPSSIAKVVIQSPLSAPMKNPSLAWFRNPYPFICGADTWLPGPRVSAAGRNTLATIGNKNLATVTTCAAQYEVKAVKFGMLPAGPTVNPDATHSGVYPDTPTHTLKLNGTNRWKIWVNDQQTSSANHPYHIHVNPFQVTDANGFSYWKDTLFISGTTNKGESNAITVLSRYENFDGKFVLHCHNLNHEDGGMMMDVEIIK